MERKNLNEDPDIPKGEGYTCPNCGEWHNDYDMGYHIDGEHYPKYFNESIGGTPDGNYHDWDEVHKCENCGTIYWFQNGAY